MLSNVKQTVFLPSFSWMTWLIENSKVCALNLPVGMNKGARGHDEARFRVSNAEWIAAIEAHPERHFRKFCSSAMDASTSPP